MTLQFISHCNEKVGYVEGISMALKGGCRWIQLRMKEASEESLYKTALIVQKMCKEYGATFIIDDKVELVKEIQADGVHLGKNDISIADAREYLGNGFIIGGTANTIEDIRSHYENGADYIGCGPYRFTTTKKGLSPVLGIEGYNSIIKCMKNEGINLPIVAIGGITINDIEEIIKTGVTGIALSGAILNANDPIKETRTILETISKWKN